MVFRFRCKLCGNEIEMSRFVEAFYAIQDHIFSEHKDELFEAVDE